MIYKKYHTSLSPVMYELLIKKDERLLLGNITKQGELTIILNDLIKSLLGLDDSFIRDIRCYYH